MLSIRDENTGIIISRHRNFDSANKAAENYIRKASKNGQRPPNITICTSLGNSPYKPLHEQGLLF